MLPPEQNGCPRNPELTGSAAPAAKPVQLILGDIGLLVEDTGTPSAPAAGKWGWSNASGSFRLRVRLAGGGSPASLPTAELRYTTSGTTAYA